MRMKKIWNWLVPLAIALVLFLLGIGLYCLLNAYFKCARDNIIAIYAGISGGVCTLIGVLLTIFSTKETEKQKSKESFIPYFFMPTNPNLALADKYRIYKRGEGESDGSPIIDVVLTFKNTDKTAFSIKELICDSVTYDGRKIFIDKKRLFSLSFTYPWKVKNVFLIIDTLDGLSYKYVIDAKKFIVTFEGEQQNVGN